MWPCIFSISQESRNKQCALASFLKNFNAFVPPLYNLSSPDRKRVCIGLKHTIGGKYSACIFYRHSIPIVNRKSIPCLLHENEGSFSCLLCRNLFRSQVILHLFQLSVNFS